MCEDPMCLSKLSPTRGRGNGGMDIYILRLTSGSYLKSGESIMTVPLDTFWKGMRGLVQSGVQPLISNWFYGSVSGLRITWPALHNCTHLILDSDSMRRLQVRVNEATESVGYETYYVPNIPNFPVVEIGPAFPLECKSVSELVDSDYGF